MGGAVWIRFREYEADTISAHLTSVEETLGGMETMRRMSERKENPEEKRQAAHLLKLQKGAGLFRTDRKSASEYALQNLAGNSVEPETFLIRQKKRYKDMKPPGLPPDVEPGEAEILQAYANWLYTECQNPDREGCPELSRIWDLALTKRENSGFECAGTCQ